MSGIPKTELTRTGRAGVLRFERMLEAIDSCRDRAGELKHDAMRKIVREALIADVKSEDRDGFAIALAGYLGIILDGSVPDHGFVGKALKHGEFDDPSYKPLPKASAHINLAIRRVLGE